VLPITSTFMASAQQCRAALDALAHTLARLDPATRERYIPHRTASVTVTDLGLAYGGHVSPDGVTRLHEMDAPEAAAAQGRFAAHSDVVVEIGQRPAAFPHEWLRGRVSVRAGWRDLLELRSLLL